MSARKGAKAIGEKERPGAVGTYGERKISVRAIGASTDEHLRLSWASWTRS
jgi:hypothetical protein